MESTTLPDASNNCIKNVKEKKGSRSKTFNLGDRLFPSKTAAREFVANWLASTTNEYEVDNIHKSFIYALLELHPDYESKIKNHNGRIFIRRNQTNSMYWNFVLGKQEPDEDEIFSYRKCFKGNALNNHHHTCTVALRSAIKDQVYEFRNVLFSDIHKDEVICPMTGEKLINDQMTHIDHHTIPFVAIVEAFLNKLGIRFSDIEIGYDYVINCFKIADDDIRRQWCAFHKENAKLMAVHKSYNLKQRHMRYTFRD